MPPAATPTSSTWGSAISSEPRLRARAGRGRAVAGAAAALVALAASSASARVFLTTEEALGLAFPDCPVERETVYLTETEMDSVETTAGTRPDTAIVHPYRAACAEHEGAVAYFDVHRVRTLPETLMVVVGPEAEVVRVELLAFREPPDYIPREPWYAQFDDQKLDDDLALKRDIRPVTGATLTARATTDAVRRVLAVHRLLTEREPRASRAGEEDGSP